MYIEETIDITKAKKGDYAVVNGQIIFGHGYAFYQTIIDKKLSYLGKITFPRLDVVALVEDYEHCDCEGGSPVLVYIEPGEVTGINDSEHVAKITIDGETRYYGEPGCWQLPDDECEYVPTGDKDAAPTKGEKEE